MDVTLPVSLVVITYNEAANIGRCLDSVPFAAEKLVVDCGSADATVDIARERGARVVHQDWLGFGPQRNFATTQCSHEWILALDADEYLSPELAAEMERRLPELMQSGLAVIFLRRTTLFMGQPMRWYKPMLGERMGRLYHRDRARWTNVRVHESLTFDGDSATLEASLIHLHNPTLVHKSLKVVRYSELKCRDWRERGRKPRMWGVPAVFFGAFIKDYLIRRGCLDGWRGFIIAQTAASYAVYKRMRYYEMCRNPDSLAQADEVLGHHGLER
ncbi:MAG TPA: glycosyltransferase family 2 protein [Gammaproteobacteria bacterium]|nr:glycosyltransferase family 2 protein [Gammaproteobacteria bacterium]